MMMRLVKKKKNFHRFSFSHLFPSFLSPSPFLSQAVSKRIQNAKSNKFFGNIHKRGLVQNTAQVRVGEKWKKRATRKTSDAISRRSEEAALEKKKEKKNAPPAALTSNHLLPPSLSLPLLPLDQKHSRQKKKGGSNVGPIMLGFFLFVVVGSALLQIIRTATSGASF